MITTITVNFKSEIIPQHSAVGVMTGIKEVLVAVNDDTLEQVINSEMRYRVVITLSSTEDYSYVVGKRDAFLMHLRESPQGISQPKNIRQVRRKWVVDVTEASDEELFALELLGKIKLVKVIQAPEVMMMLFPNNYRLLEGYKVTISH